MFYRPVVKRGTGVPPGVVSRGPVPVAAGTGRVLGRTAVVRRRPRRGDEARGSGARWAGRLARWWAGAVRAGALVALSVAMLVVGAGLSALGPRLPVARPAAWPGPGAAQAAAPAFGVWPLLVVLAVAPGVLAVMLILVWQRAAALALIAAVGAVAVGRVVLDLALMLQPLAAARPELVAPAAIDGLRAAPGGWLLVAGQLCTVLAGLLAAAEVGRCRGEHGLVAPAGAARVPARVPPVALGVALVAAAGLLAAPFGTGLPFLSDHSVFDAPPAVAAGRLLLAAGIVLATALAASAPDHRVVAGGLVGVALGVLAVAVPSLVVASLAPGFRPTPGPVMAVLGAFGLAVLARSVVRAAWAEPRDQADRPPRPATGVPRVVLADDYRRIGGALCVLAGGCAVAAFVADPVRLVEQLPGGAGQPRLPTQGLLLSTGLVLAAVGTVTAFSRVGRLVRPGLAVLAMAMPMAAAEYVTAVLGVLELPGVDAGWGWWLAMASVTAALAGAFACALAGGLERDEVDLTDCSFHGPTAAPAASAAVLAVAGFVLPLVGGAGRGVTGVFQAPYGLPSWALLAAMATVVGVGLLGPRCRPERAAVLYTGACLVLVLRLARIVFGPRPLPSAGLAEGAVATALCLVLMLAAASVSASTAARAGLAGAQGSRGTLSSRAPVVGARGGCDHG